MEKAAREIVLLLALSSLSGCASLGGSEFASPRSQAAAINLKLGIGYMQSGHYDVALEKLNKALRFDDDSAEIHNAIAVLYEELKEIGPAETHYQRAIELKSDYALAYMNYGRFLCARGKPAEGEKQFLAAARLATLESPESAYTGAGICARLTGDLERAEAHLRQALEVNPRNPRALYELAGLSLAQGEPLQARAFLQRYHAVIDYSPASLWLGIRIEEALGDISSRREYASILLARFADSTEARRLSE